MKGSLTAAAIVAAAILAGPAAAQDLVRDSSWTVTYDDPSVADSSLFLVVMKPGWHITTPAGSGVTLSQSDSSATGNFLLKSVVFTFNADAKPFGPLFARRGDNGAPTEFVSVLLNNDGTVGLFHNAGPERHTIVSWTASDAIVRQVDTDGPPVKNVVTVLVSSSTLRVYVNGREVIQQAVQHDFDGGIGFRVGAGTNLHVSELTVAALGTD
jgi:hypothetical protein